MSRMLLLVFGLNFLISSSQGNSCSNLDMFPKLFNNYTFSGTPLLRSATHGILRCVEECKETPLCQGFTLHQMTGVCSLYSTVGHSNTSGRGTLITSAIRDWTNEVKSTSKTSKSHNETRRLEIIKEIGRRPTVNETKGFQNINETKGFQNINETKGFQNINETKGFQNINETKGPKITYGTKGRKTISETRGRPTANTRRLHRNDDGCAVFKDYVSIYSGTVNVTRTGLQCQRWDQQHPHKHSITESKYFYTGESVTEVANYCRNPYVHAMWATQWCYTANPSVRWQFCDIEECEPYEGTDCFTVRDLSIVYTGTRNTTMSGRTCQRWGTRYPHNITGIGSRADVNYCRPIKPYYIPWCYTTDPDKEWEFCGVRRCPKNTGGG